MVIDELTRTGTPLNINSVLTPYPRPPESKSVSSKPHFPNRLLRRLPFFVSSCLIFALEIHVLHDRSPEHANEHLIVSVEPQVAAASRGLGD